MAQYMLSVHHDGSAQYARGELEEVFAAEVMIREGYYRLSAFLCQQAVEMLLKAIWFERRNTEPPRTHNLFDLARDLEVLPAWSQFLPILTAEAVVSRYAHEEPYQPDEAVRRLEWTVEICRELRALLT
jgi:HEPN domain-containing protein